MITHDREHFYKYVSADTAKAILKNGSVRWSSPRLFNDPFDIQFDLHLPFSEEEYIEAMEKRLVEIYLNGRTDEIKTDNPATKLFNLLFDHMRARVPDMTKEDLLNEFRPATKEGYARGIKALEQIHEEIRVYLSDLCVFCVSETRDDLLMWSHYSDSHQGAVLKLQCLPEQDTALCAATQVSYQKQMPVWASLEKFIDSNFGGESPNARTFLNAITATKSENWGYEKEWRAITSFRNLDEIRRGYSDYKIVPEEIVEITFGCRMSDDDKVELAALTAPYPNAQLSQASVHPKRFELEFSPIQIL